MLPVYLGGAVCLQFDLTGRTGRLIRLRGLLRLVVGPFDPVASKLGEQDERERAPAAEDLAPVHKEQKSFLCRCQVTIYDTLYCTSY